MDLRGKRCLVTGAGRGLGRQIARALAQAGARVHVCDRSDEALADVRREEPDWDCRVCNVADEAAVQALFAAVAAEGPLDVLVNNAGITRDGLLLKRGDDGIRALPLEQFRAVIDVNLTGVFLCAREAARAMAEQGGVIINLSSVSRAGNVGQTAYSASKAGVDAMTVTWSKELARYGIRCVAIAPGYTNTEMVAAIRPEILDKIKAQVPLRRLGEMDEIARTVRFVIENDFVNGKVIEVDGGLRI